MFTCAYAGDIVIASAAIADAHAARSVALPRQLDFITLKLLAVSAS
jgi:hypothetical protein